ncbi:MAG: HD domain-containing protein [Sedimentisphaerales bacterium]|nr:HD domain-containing protein [Sedimentisphaerales bacterium]
MLRVPIQQARGGMVLARSVPNPQQPQQMLLKAGFELDSDSITRLKTLRIFSLWVQYPSLDFLDELIDPEIIRKQQKLYGALKSRFEENQEWSLAKLEYSEYVSQMTAFFSRLLSHNKSAIYIDELQGEDEDVFVHGVAVATMAMMTGMKLEGYLLHERPRIPPHQATDLTYLGVGCLLHDIGKLSLPEELRKFHLTGHDRGCPEWQKHTEAGFEMIHGGLDRIAAQVVLNHHQHFDGSGFPGRRHDGFTPAPTPLSGHDIHVFCRIASIADRFEGFRHLPDGSLAPNVVALSRLRKSGYRKWFDPQVFEAFMFTVPPFAPGDQVELNDGQLVVVTELNDCDLCRPVVRPIDPDAACSKERPQKTEDDKSQDINLALRGDLYIAKVGDFDICKYLYSTEDAPEAATP